MTINITGPDGSNFAFPDNTPQDEISTALDSHYQGGGLTGKVGRFLTNVYNNPPPTIAGIRDIIKGAPTAANELTFGSNPEAATQAAGTMLKAAALGTPAAPGLRAGEGVMAAPMGKDIPIPAVPARPTMAPITAADLKTARAANYKTAFGSGVEVAAPIMHDTYGATLAQIAKDFDPSQAPSTFRILSEAAIKFRPKSTDPLQAMTGAKPAEKAPATGLDIESVQQKLQAIRPNLTHPQDNPAAKRARALIDEALANVPDAAVIKGDAQAFRDAIAAGRGNTAAMYRMKGLEGAEERANLSSESTYSGGNVENPMRQNAKSLVMPPVGGGPSKAEKMGYNPQERQAIRDVAAPGLLRDTLRAIGKAAPTDYWRTLGNLELAKITGGMSLPVTGITYGAKKLGDSLAQRSLENAMGLVSSRSPLYQARLAEYQRQLAAHLRAAQAAREAQAANGGILSGLPPTGLLGSAQPFVPQLLPPTQQ